MADEAIVDHASLIAVIKADAADIVKLKVMKQGGFHRTRRSFRIEIRTDASSMDTGSSARMNSGLRIIARATATRCR